MGYRKMKFYRLQDTGISFEDMQSYDSADYTSEDEIGQPGGLCVTDDVDGEFGGAWGAYDNARPGEIVVMEGHIVEQIYDGYRIRPTREIARFSTSEWMEMVDSETIDDILNKLQDQ